MILSTTHRERLSKNAAKADADLDWPFDSWRVLRDSGALGWSIPKEFGGAGLGPVDVLRGMEEIASRCLTTAFVLSQREAAIRHLLRGPESLKCRYLPRLAAGDDYATVGLSHLTTSRQHLSPAVRATPLACGGYQLDGEIPWVTGADQAAAVVAGATLPDGNQLLFAIPGDRLANAVDTPLALAALSGSRTSLIRCQGLKLDADAVLSGPAQNVLGKSTGGGLDTSCLAIGLAAAAIEFIRKESESRHDLVPMAERFETMNQSHRDRLHTMAGPEIDSSQALPLRFDCTKLVLRSTQASLMIAKGIGFVTPHSAQLWVRQAMFFLVWSCPRPVVDQVLAELSVAV